MHNVLADVYEDALCLYPTHYICTTTSTPASDWPGVSLAGSGASNILLLNDGNGALSGAGELYFNFKVIIPGGYLIPSSHNPIFAITFTTN